MPRDALSVVRVLVILLSLGLIGYLLSKGEMPPQVRIVVVAALAYYAIRLWVVGSRTRRARRARAGRDGHEHDPPDPAD